MASVIPIFRLKGLIPVTGVLLVLQGIAEIIRCVICIREGSWPQRLHDVEETESVVIRERLEHKQHAVHDGSKGGLA